ncbi:lactonase family protein [Paenibacillus xerothermodurans]|nr:lactonase family protein [Paenibacillus xerothermodurans]
MSTTTKGYRYVYVGSYAEASSPGIFVYAFDVNTGALTRVDAVAGIENPSYLTLDTKRNCLYAVSETSAPYGSVHSFAIEHSTGKLLHINEQSTFGGAPCYVSLDRTGEWLFVSNYSGGNLCVYPINRSGGVEKASCQVQHHGGSIRADRQESAHPHSILVDPTNRYVHVPDLGQDKIVVYQLDRESGELQLHSEVSAQPGAGPRHFAFHPNGKFAYGINELNSTVTAYAYDKTEGALHSGQIASTLPAGYDGVNICADIHISPTGRFLYGSNRGHDSIIVFAIDPKDGTLTYVEHVSTQGKTPRNFAISPDNRFLLAANQDSNSIVTFAIDQHTGTLRPVADETLESKPVCIKFAL